MSSRRTRTASQSFHEKLTLATLEKCIEEDYPYTVGQCINDGVDVNATTYASGLTPLELALQKRNIFIMQMLLDAGANTEQRNNQGKTILTTAIRYGFLDGVKLLVERGASLNLCGYDGTRCLRAAVSKNYYSIVAYLLKQDSCRVNVSGKDGLLLLQSAVLTDDADLVSNLKIRGLDLDARRPEGTNAVFFAVKNCKNKALKALLEFRADPNVRTVDGRLALHEAARRNNIKAVKNLMAHGANASIVDKGGLTPTDLAIEKKSLPLLKVLLEYGANVEQKCTGGTTPLLAACSQGFLEGVQLLVERGANLYARAANGRACLLLALDNGHQSIVDYLTDQGASDVNIRGSYDLSGLHYAVVLNNANMMRELLQEEADVNVQNHDGEVPVYLAARDGKVDLLRMLLEAGAVPNIDTKDGDFALHQAVKYGDVEAVELLLEHGADKERLDKNGMTPVEVAMALVPPPEDIIHCLLTDSMEDEDANASNSVESHVEDNKRIFDAAMEEALCCCPITFETMKDPVIAMDGHTYEREAIEEWIREKRESPVTRQPLTSSILIPNLSIKHLIDRYANPDGDS